MKNQTKKSVVVAAAPETVKTTVRIKRELWTAVRKRAIDENVDFQSLVEMALTAYLETKGTRA